MGGGLQMKIGSFMGKSVLSNSIKKGTPAELNQIQTSIVARGGGKAFFK